MDKLNYRSMKKKKNEEESVEEERLITAKEFLSNRGCEIPHEFIDKKYGLVLKEDICWALILKKDRVF